MFHKIQIFPMVVSLLAGASSFNSWAGTNNPYMSKVDDYSKELARAENYPSYSEVRFQIAKRVITKLTSEQKTIDQQNQEAQSRLDDTGSEQYTLASQKVSKAKDAYLAANVRYNYLVQGGGTASSRPIEKQIADQRETTHAARRVYEKAQAQYAALLKNGVQPTPESIGRKAQAQEQVQQLSDAKLAYETLLRRARNDSVNPLDNQDLSQTASAAGSTPSGDSKQVAASNYLAGQKN